MPISIIFFRISKIDRYETIYPNRRLGVDVISHPVSLQAKCRPLIILSCCRISSIDSHNALVRRIISCLLPSFRLFVQGCVLAMFRISPNFRRDLFTIGLIVFFSFVYPTWNASAKMDIHHKRPSSMMFEPVSKVVSNTRKLLLSRMESARIKELMDQTFVTESAFTAPMSQKAGCTNVV